MSVRSHARPGSLLRALVLAPALAGAAGCVVTSAPAFPPGNPVLSLPRSILSPAAPVASFRDGPPARVTGGFGEDSCHACHFGATPNDEAGAIALSGFPGRYMPGETYELELTVARAEMAVAGFQLAIRHTDDMSQAGHLQAAETGRVGVLDEQGVLFAHQLLDGTEPSSEHTARWTLVWTAPQSGRQIAAHVAALAGDGDDSQLGDHVYTLERIAHPEDAARHAE